MRLSDYLEYEQPTKYSVSSENYDDSYLTPVLTPGQSFILGYTDETEGIFDASKEPIILFDDFTTSIKYVDFPFKVKSSACKILHAKANNNIKFLYYYLKSINYKVSVHKRHWISEFSNLEVKEFSLEEQNSIVEKISKIEEALQKKEILAKEYEELIISSFQEKFGSNTDIKKYKIADIVDEIFAGGDVPKNSMSKEKTEDYKIPIFTNGETNEGLYGYTNVARVNKEALTISARGTIGYMKIRKEPFYPAIRLITIIPREDVIRINYLMYALKGLIKSNGTSIPQLTTPIVKKYEIPVPNIREQENFEEFVSKINDNIKLINKEIRELECLLNSRIFELFQ